MATQKRKTLNFDQKVEAIKLLDSGKLAYKVAEIYMYGVKKTKIQNLRKRKLEVLTAYENNATGSQKRQCGMTANEDINQQVTFCNYKCTCSCMNINVTDLKKI